MMDSTHDQSLTCWVASANGHDQFPIQNLPIGIFAPGTGRRRGGIAIGNSILDVGGLLAGGLLTGDAADAASAASGDTLNPLLELGGRHRLALRRRISELLSDADAEAHLHPLVHAAKDCVLHLPADIGDYTDFYAGIHHATAVGTLFRPDAPLLPNYKHVPIAYHGRASSIRASGVTVRRPRGQVKMPDASVPIYEPTKRLDFELEIGIWVGPGSELGVPVPIGQAHEHIAGYCLLNDWSARDIQAWEYQPLGPFLAKNFCTSISPWIVTLEALAPFRKTLPAQDPEPLPYLRAKNDFTFDVQLEARLQTAKMKAPQTITRTNFLNLYWSVSQQLAHHTVGGCNLQPGDLLASGTISGETENSRGCMLELTWRGANPLKLSSGEERKWLEDGDTLSITGWCQGDGYRVGFGEVSGKILATH